MGPVTGLDGVTVVLRDGRPALRDVTLLAEAGEILAVLGPSGSGKTTVLRTVAGLQPPQRGEVYVAGRRVTGVAPRERDLAMVFQEAGLVPFLDVATNMARGLRQHRVPEAEVAERVEGRGRLLGLGGLMRRMPRTLSAGETARAGIGRALVRAPRAFLLDEPLAHLDAGDRARTRRTITDLVAGAGVAALYVTHDRAEAMAVADRLAVLRDGEVVQVDRPMAVYRRPVDLFVAGMLAAPALGLLPARLVATAAGAGFRVGARTLPLWAPPPAALAGHVDRPVLLGLHCSDVTGVTGAGEADPASVTLPGTVTTVERTGPDALAAVRVDAVAAGEPLWARFPGRSRVRPGDRVEVAVDAARAHVFDPATGTALHHPDG